MKYIIIRQLWNLFYSSFIYSKYISHFFIFVLYFIFIWFFVWKQNIVSIVLGTLSFSSSRRKNLYQVLYNVFVGSSFSKKVIKRNGKFPSTSFSKNKNIWTMKTLYQTLFIHVHCQAPLPTAGNESRLMLMLYKQKQA